MRKLLLLFNLICFLCVSCNKENHDLEEQDESGIVQINVYYTTDENPDDELPDSNSKLFVYYGKYSGELFGYTFQNGELVKGEQTIDPDQRASINKNGVCTLHLDYIDKPFTIIVESNYYKKTTADSFPSGKKKSTITVVFGPFSEQK